MRVAEIIRLQEDMTSAQNPSGMSGCDTRKNLFHAKQVTASATCKYAHYPENNPLSRQTACKLESSNKRSSTAQRLPLSKSNTSRGSVTKPVTAEAAAV